MAADHNRSELPKAQLSLVCWNKNVYDPSDDSFLLVDMLEQWASEHWSSRKQPLTAVEVGCGSGYVVCSLALMLRHLKIPARLFAVDHSEDALAATRTTLAQHQVCYVDLCASDLLNGFGKQVFDVVVFNPPYVPTPDEEVLAKDITSAWAGGHRGRVVIDRFLKKIKQHLTPCGEVFLVTVAENDPQGIIKEMQIEGFTGHVMGTRQADEERLSIVHLKLNGDMLPVV